MARLKQIKTDHELQVSRNWQFPKLLNNLINTSIRLQSGQRVAFFARGLISYNGGQLFTTPEGIICNQYGIPFLSKDPNKTESFAIWLHPEAYKTNGGELGRIGSLIGWINQYTEQDSFLIDTLDHYVGGDVFIGATL